MRLIISRHGNTFSHSEKVVWIGGEADPPLVPEGERQASGLGIALRAAKCIPSAAYCSPLQRAHRYAEIALATAGVSRPLIVDRRLNEIDYGSWNGLSNDEVLRRFGPREFFGWYHRSIWPASQCWNSPVISLRHDFCRTLN